MLCDVSFWSFGRIYATKVPNSVDDIGDIAILVILELWRLGMQNQVISQQNQKSIDLDQYSKITEVI